MEKHEDKPEKKINVPLLNPADADNSEDDGNPFGALDKDDEDPGDPSRSDRGYLENQRIHDK